MAADSWTQITVRMRPELRAKIGEAARGFASINQWAVAVFEQACAGTDVGEAETKSEEFLAGSFRRVNGFMWADVDDTDQLARARIIWAETSRDQTPAVLPYHGSADQNPELFSVEKYTPEQLWAWVGRYTG